MFEELNKQFWSVSDPTRALILTCYLKFCKDYPQLIPRIAPIFRKHATQIDPEIQQRAVEYFCLVHPNAQRLLVRFYFTFLKAKL